MLDAILTTKLYIPPARSELVSRPRLIERLTEGLTRKLIVISAPAGSGKTTLLGEWVGNSELPAAWVSLDESDNDPTRFLTYIVAALKTIDADMGAGALSLLQSPQPRPAELILTSLINEVAETARDFILVLDDFHVIELRPIHDALTFLVDSLPPQMHLVIASRADPPLPLARLRGRGEVIELRAADLRFAPDEAAAFLNQVMGLSLSAKEVAALETRTEGWIAGLQMAALSMQGRNDIASYVQSFTGSHRFILDYLVEEVLERQPELERSFLLQTSVLDRLSGPLCDAVTGQDDGKGMLETLERGNLFVVPLDDKRQWYRYHHLFADVLQARSMEEQPDQVPLWHRRASDWYEQNGLLPDAIRHAFAAEDFERAADLVELATKGMLRSKQDATLMGWIRALPEELAPGRPVLSVGYAWASLASGEPEAAESHLRVAERWLDAAGEGSDDRSGEMVVLDEEGFSSLPATIAVLRSVQAQARGDVSGTLEHARRAYDLAPESDYYWRGAGAALLGLASWASGDLQAAYRTFADGLASLEAAGNIADAISGTLILADIRKAQGRLHQALRICEKALQVAMNQGEPVLPGTADLYVGMSDLYREWGDMDAATQHLRQGEKLGERARLPDNRYRWCVVQARINEAQGNLDSAVELLDEAERLHILGVNPNVRPIAAIKIRIWIAQGMLSEAHAWAQDRSLSVDDDLSYLLEFEHITLARVLIAQHSSNREQDPIGEALDLLGRMLKAAEKEQRTGSAIELLVLEAIAYEAQGDIAAALVPLERALTLAEPEGYVRTFVDEGPPMEALLREASKHGVAPNYVGRLQAGFAGAQGTTPVAQSLVEPLSERELEVLRMLRSELTGPEIASELMVSLNTMRTHTKNIYSKLDVNSRRAAVRRAEELDLL